MNVFITSPCEKITTKLKNFLIFLACPQCNPLLSKLASPAAGAEPPPPKSRRGGGSENKTSLEKSHFIGKKRAQQQG